MPDLTRLSQANGEKFPFEEVQEVVDGRNRSRWHQRRREMPYWGDVFQVEQQKFSKAKVESRITAIVDYVRSLQEK